MRSMRGGDVQVCNRSGELHAVRGGDVRTFRRWTTLVRPQRFLPLLTALPPSMKCCVTKLDLSDNESCSAAGAGRCLTCPTDTFAGTAGAVACDQVQRAFPAPIRAHDTIEEKLTW